MKLTKVAYGWYANEDGTWAVIGDNPGDIHSKLEAEGGDAWHAPGIGTGCATQREWQVVRDPAGRLRQSHLEGETVDWVDSLAQGRKVVDRLAAQA